LRFVRRTFDLDLRDAALRQIGLPVGAVRGRGGKLLRLARGVSALGWRNLRARRLGGRLRRNDLVVACGDGDEERRENQLVHCAPPPTRISTYVRARSCAIQSSRSCWIR